jgi:hypothetical protein
MPAVSCRTRPSHKMRMVCGRVRIRFAGITETGAGTGLNGSIWSKTASGRGSRECQLFGPFRPKAVRQ